MIELVNTSAPDGLLPGTHGFSTVAMTRGTPDTLRATLEGLSSYVHRASGHDARYWTDNPVAWHHVAPPRSGHVLSRVAACDFDYTGRTNRIARHWQSADAEWPAGCNAARVLLSRRAWFEAPWTGEPRWLTPGDAGRLSADGGAAAGTARQWTALYGAIGRTWAEKLAGELSKQLGAGTAGRPLIMATDPAWDRDGTKLLGLFADLIDLLSERERAKATFSTYAAVLAGWVPCAMRGLLADDPSMGALTAGRPWFDAVAGTLHREELLDGGVAVPKAKPGLALKEPSKKGGEGASGGKKTGRRGPKETHRERRQTERKAENAVFWVLAAMLAGTLGFLGYTVAGGKGNGRAAAIQRGGRSAGVASVEAGRPEEGAADEASGGRETTDMPVAAVAAGAPKRGGDGKKRGGEKPERLWEGATWRADKPRPGESGVVLWQYPPDGNALVPQEVRGVTAGGAQAWVGISPDFRTVRLWRDAENRVYWEFENPKGLELEVDGETESLDWRALWFGPDKRIWAEWEAETKGRPRRVRFDAKAAFGKPPHVLTHVWGFEATGQGPVSVARLWDEARSGVQRQTAGARERLDREIAEMKGELDNLRRELDEKKRRLRDLQRTRGNLMKEAGERLARRRRELAPEYKALLHEYPTNRYPEGGTTRMKAIKQELDDLDYFRNDPIKAPMNQVGDEKLQSIESEIWNLEARLDELEAQIDGIEASAAPKRAALKDMQPPEGGKGPKGQGRPDAKAAGRLKVRLTVDAGDEETAK